MDECQYRRLYNYVETKNKSGEYVLRRSSKNYVVEEEKLYYVDKTADKKVVLSSKGERKSSVSSRSVILRLEGIEGGIQR